jgi:VCBS repeat protein
LDYSVESSKTSSAASTASEASSNASEETGESVPSSGVAASTGPVMSPGNAPPGGSGDDAEHAKKSDPAPSPTTRAALSRRRRRTMQISIRALALLVVAGAAAIAGCGGGTGGQAPPVPSNEPGSTASTSTTISCAKDTDCLQGEACTGGLCQMKRCAGTFTSSSPLGANGYVMIDRELLVDDQVSSLGVYTAQTLGLSADPRAGALGVTSTFLDLAGGNFTGTRPEQVTYVDGSNNLTVVGSNGKTSTMNVGWPASFVATGDVDGDGLDEIIVAGTGQQYAVCSVARSSCDQGTLAAAPVDVAVGDVDGDGYAEAIFVSGTTVTVVNVNSQKTGEQASVPVTIPQTLAYVTSGDLDGDGIAELIGKDNGGSIPYIDHDHLYVYDLGGGALTQKAEYDLGQNTLDLAYVPFANNPRVAVLTDSATVQVFSYGNASLSPQFQSTLGSSGATRLGAADVDGNSPMMAMTKGPTLQAGPSVPLAVLTLPPYSTTHSSGPSSVWMGAYQENGTGSSQGSSTSTSVSLTLGMGIGFGGLGGFSLGPSLSAYVTGHLAWSSSHSQGLSTNLSVGSSYSMTANPQVDGYDSAGVVMGCGCYHQYDYEVDDPAGMLGQGQGQHTISLFVPVGGETTFWSSRRYNALATALGGGQLPPVTIGYKLGDVASYPTSPSTLDGQSIAPADMVFTSPPTVQTSDVGELSFWLTSGQSTTNTTASSFSYGASASVGAGLSIGIFNVSAQASGDQTWTLDQSYSVTVGSSTTFSGTVSPIRDDPNAPGDNSALYGYSFEPIVYRQHFTGAANQAGAFYVLTYAVTQQPNQSAQ